MVNVGTGTAGSKIINSNYPNIEGHTAGTTSINYDDIDLEEVSW